MRKRRHRQSRSPGRERLERLGRAAVRLMLGLVIAAAGLIEVAGCARTAAKTVPDGPPLDVPQPPARVVIPAEEPLAAAPTEPVEPAPAPASTTRRPVRRPANAEPAQKPEPAPPVEAQPSPPSQAEASAATPAPTLRAPGSAEKPVRDLVARAQRDLSRVDYARLTDAGREQYEQSKRFVQQAEQALKDQNFVFAQTLADKAATLAAELLR